MAGAEIRQEPCCYLRSMHRQWKGFLGSSVEPHCLDAETVKSFHVLMPAHSSKDSQEICASMRNLQAFPRVRSPTIRQEIEARLLSCERILTFKSFHHDMILLEGCYQRGLLCRAHVKRHSGTIYNIFAPITSTCGYVLCASTHIYQITLQLALKRK